MKAVDQMVNKMIEMPNTAPITVSVFCPFDSQLGSYIKSSEASVMHIELSIKV
jgi:hypothetical protein